jgi:hypothetical protein
MTTDNTVRATEREVFLRRSSAEIRQLGRRAVQDIVEIGKLLTECKAKLGHGEWLPWIEREFGWSDRTARNFMRVHEMLSGKSEIISDLAIDATALYALASKSVPNSVREQMLARAQQGEHISQRTLAGTVGMPSGPRTTIVPFYPTPRPKQATTLKIADPSFKSAPIHSDQLQASIRDSYKSDDLLRSESEAIADRVIARDRMNAGFAQQVIDAIIAKMGAPPDMRH